MKTPTSSIFTAVVFLLLSVGFANAQTYVLESPVTVLGTITVQGPEITTTGPFGQEVKRVTLDVKPWNNRQLLAELNELGLLDGSTDGWKLRYLEDQDQVGGVYASKRDLPPVAVPPELLTLPSFTTALQTGRETTRPGGATVIAASEIAAASATVGNVTVNGIAHNRVRTVTYNLPAGGRAVVDTVTMVMPFHGGGEVNGVYSIRRGTLFVGAARLSREPALPPLD